MYYFSTNSSSSSAEVPLHDATLNLVRPRKKRCQTRDSSIYLLLFRMSCFFLRVLGLWGSDGGGGRLAVIRTPVQYPRAAVLPWLVFPLLVRRGHVEACHRLSSIRSLVSFLAVAWFSVLIDRGRHCKSGRFVRAKVCASRHKSIISRRH